MHFDQYGFSKSFCEDNGYKIFFGTDWLDDSEFEAFEKFFDNKTLKLNINKGSSEPSELASFEDAVRLESQFVDVDKIITVENHSALYISDDRDIFVVAAKEDTLSKLVEDIVRAGGKTYSSLVGSGVVEPKKQVKDYFNYWASLNVELPSMP
ncbi:hypothetical protein [Rhizobium skierniewicense]|uniref:hypothetical protein n=1 Tax=Rhizobium skierniewicense TaxID=984260 RepID=UPI00157167BE|nr:hypothetical protein [Rhizobium skierniewicense]NTF33959.1 hypothetical protein [Rhizobium skierniewicense]